MGIFGGEAEAEAQLVAARGRQMEAARSRGAETLTGRGARGALEGKWKPGMVAVGNHRMMNEGRGAGMREGAETGSVEMAFAQGGGKMILACAGRGRGSESGCVKRIWSRDENGESERKRARENSMS